MAQTLSASISWRGPRDGQSDRPDHHDLLNSCDEVQCPHWFKESLSVSKYGLLLPGTQVEPVAIVRDAGVHKRRRERRGAGGWRLVCFSGMVELIVAFWLVHGIALHTSTRCSTRPSAPNSFR
jgi:hypothetical protein